MVRDMGSNERERSEGMEDWARVWVKRRVRSAATVAVAGWGKSIFFKEGIPLGN